jgi:multidrug resistance protein MdtO
MATPVADRLARFARLLGPTPGRLQFAGRLALICALTTLVVEYYRTPEPALTAYVAFFFIKPDRATTVALSIIMVLLISLVVAMLLPIVMAVADDPVRRVGAMALLSFGLLFLASASKLRPIGGIVALIAAFALDLLGQVHIAEIATRAVLYLWLFIAIPAGLTIMVSLLLGPAPRRLVEGALADRLALAARRLVSDDPGVRRSFAEALHETPGESPAWLKAAALERTSPAQDLAALRQAERSTTAVLLLVDLLVREAALDARWRRRLAATLAEMAAILRRGRYPLEITFEPPPGAAQLEPSAAAIVGELRATLAAFAEPQEEGQRAPAGPRAGFFLPDAFTNPAHVRYALKTTAAALFCYFVYSLLDWPGIHTCLITCYIVSLGTAAETIEKLSLRIGGCLLGAAAGIAAIVFLIPQITSIGALMAVVFCGAFVSAWIAAGSPRIAYAGFQVAFAFFLSVLQGPAPAFDMTIARDRVIGVIFGNLVVYVLFTNVWPVSVAGRIDPAIQALLKRLSAMAREPRRMKRVDIVSEVNEAASAVAQDLELAVYEPRGLRPSARWLASRRRAVREISALEGPLLIGVARPERRAEQLEALTQALDGHDRATGHVRMARDPIDRRLANLERALVRGTERTTVHVPA